MAEGAGSKEPEDNDKTPTRNGEPADGTPAPTAGEGEGEDEDDEEEPRLKYAPITKRLSSLYRNGDAVSAFLVSGDKMVCAVPRR
jgi:vacuolar protein sorting-associated protein 41